MIDVADAGFDNFSPEREGVIEIPGRKGRICPTSGIVGNVIQQMICAQWTDEMVRRGSVPYYWMGFFQAGGRPYDDAIRPHFEGQGFSVPHFFLKGFHHHTRGNQTGAD